jgi:AcrR family transcriptional regulator
MNKPKEQKDVHQEILTAAAKVFGTNGYSRSTTRLIAKEANVTEVTLFRHFESKEKLFAAIVEIYGGGAIAADLEAQLTGDYRADLLMIGSSFLATLLARRNMVRTMLAEAEHFPELAEMLSQNPRLLHEMLARYLRSQMDRGAVGQFDPETAAHAFWGMFFTHGLTVGTYADQARNAQSNEQLVERYVDIFINGTIRKE